MELDIYVVDAFTDTQLKATQPQSYPYKSG